MADAQLCETLRNTLTSPNVTDANGETANMVDAIAGAGQRIQAGLKEVAKAILHLAEVVERH